jgi:hypothetical protein
MNVEHRTFNIEGLMEVGLSFEVGRSMFNVRRSFRSDTGRPDQNLGVPSQQVEMAYILASRSLTRGA